MNNPTFLITSVLNSSNGDQEELRKKLFENGLAVYTSLSGPVVTAETATVAQPVSTELAAEPASSTTFVLV